MLAIKRDLSDDHANPHVVDHLGHDLLVERLTDGDSSIFRGGLKKAMNFCEVRKIPAKKGFSTSLGHHVQEVRYVNSYCNSTRKNPGSGLLRLG
jgi:hypothetical protein